MRFVAALGLAAAGIAFAQERGDVVVIRVQDVPVTREEFSSRLNLIPQPGDRQPDSLRRQACAASLIAEKILALEAQRLRLDTMELMQKAVHECEREAVYEHWMKREIADGIRCTEAELRQAYTRFVEQRIVDYRIFADSAAANDARRQAANEGRPQSPNGHGDTVGLGTKVISFGESIGPVEDAVYNLNVGGTSGVIRLENQFYLFRLKAVRPHPVYSTQTLAYWKPAIEKRIRERKTLEQFSARMSAILRKKPFTIDRGRYLMFQEGLAARIPFDDPARLSIPEAVNQELARPADDIVMHAGEPFIAFGDGSSWSVGDVWEKLRFGPYLLNYRNREELRSGFPELLRRMVLIESVMAEGYRNGYASAPPVVRETQLWRDHVLAQFYEHHAAAAERASVQPEEASDDSIRTRVQDAIERLIAVRAKEYAITLKTDVIRNIDVLAGTAMIRKSHFPNRMAVPLAVPRDPRAEWFQRLWSQKSE